MKLDKTNFESFLFVMKCIIFRGRIMKNRLDNKF